MGLFNQLAPFRDRGPDGPLALKPGVIEDWCRMTGTELRRDEIMVLWMADAAYRSAYQDEQIRQIELAKQKSKNQE